MTHARIIGKIVGHLYSYGCLAPCNVVIQGELINFLTFTCVYFLTKALADWLKDKPWKYNPFYLEE